MIYIRRTNIYAYVQATHLLRSLVRALTGRRARSCRDLVMTRFRIDVSGSISPIYVYTNIWLYLFIYVNVYEYLHIYACVCKCLYPRICILMCTCLMYMQMYVYVYVQVYIYEYVPIYIRKHMCGQLFIPIATTGHIVALLIYSHKS